MGTETYHMAGRPRQITILTICPEMFIGFLDSHILSLARERCLARVTVTDLKTYAQGSFRAIDDSPYGGGNGMILRAKPILDAMAQIRSAAREGERIRTVVLSPAGRPYDQKKARELAQIDHLVLICGHYEGIDQRAVDAADEVISIGDYILSGGEIPAMVLADSVIRLLPGCLKEGSASEESFENGLLEYPQYTQPRSVYGREVPEVLLCGNHDKIRQYRLESACSLTRRVRPDLWEKYTGKAVWKDTAEDSGKDPE